MRSYLLITTTLVFSLIGCSPSVDSNGTTQPLAAEDQSSTATTPESELDATLNLIYPADEPGITVVASRGGEVIYQSARGMADLELGVAMRPEHVLKIGSITKQFTAAAILRLEEQGKLTMQSKVGELLPGFHEPDLTVHQLLNHTSGLPSYTDDGEYTMGNGIRADVDTAEIIALTSDLPLHFVPGEDWRYSNSGYVVLGAIIEKLSNLSWHEFIARELIEPLHLQKTGYFNAAEIVTDRIPGYMYEEGFVNAPFISMTQPHAAGAFYATATELDKWQYALHSGQVLTAASYAKMIDQSQGLNDYAYGLGVSKLQGTTMISHGGGIHGFSAYGLWLPEYELSVVALTNRMAPGMSASVTAMRLAAQLIDKPFPIEKATADIGLAELNALVGTYSIEAGGKRVLYLEGSTLYSKRDDGPAYAVRYVGEDQFVFADTLTFFEVVRDEMGKVTGLNFFQRDTTEAEVSRKISDEVQLREAVELSDEQIKRLVGDYQLQPNFVISIRHTEAGITAQATGQSAFLVEASSTDVLFSEQFGIVMEFELPSAGMATQLNLLQGGQNMPAPRIESSLSKEDE